jgi:GNAT superfamily N-acetyltransferase
VRIESLADHLELTPLVARWHWEEWGRHDPGGSLEAWTVGLARRTERGRVPTTYLALDGGDPVGSATLVACDMLTRCDLSPWLAGVYVLPVARGRGVASALVRHAVRRAGGMGVPRLYLYTASASGLYRKLGWRSLETTEYEGARVTIMAIDIPSGGGG